MIKRINTTWPDAFLKRTAIVDDVGRHTYSDLLRESESVAKALLSGRADLDEARVALLAEPGFNWAAAFIGIWRAGGTAVPLAVSHPKPELEYVIRDSGASVLVASRQYRDKLAPIANEQNLPLLCIEDIDDKDQTELPEVSSDRRALIVYTSGTTGRPKGVVISHDQISAMIESMVSAWGWTGEDSILHVLPLHHVHGIVNVLLTPLYVGATCHIMEKFRVEAAWERFMAGGLTLFMAVPTIYARLIRSWEEFPTEIREKASESLDNLRLMVSGSMALPPLVLEKWREISGHTLLERYGMTEIGMALTNPLNGPRVPGEVGVPMPGVDVRLVVKSGETEEGPGEIQVKGPNVFNEYWKRPDDTAEVFTPDGWFKTGDVAVVNNGRFRILGRASVDIIKTGGYKVSALDVEAELLAYPNIRECAVVGVEDPEWGQRVAAAVVLNQGETLSLKELRAWAKDRLAPYKIPSLLKVLEELPRNAMGKVTKPEVMKMWA